MSKKIVSIALLVCLLLPLCFLTPAARAAGDMAVTASTATVQFPARLVFNLTARSSINIVDVRLDYSVDQAGFADITSESVVSFTPSTQVSVSYPLEMLRVGGFPAGTVIKYWWRLKDASGNSLTSQANTVSFDDTNHNWRVLPGDMISLRWYTGNDSFGQQLMDAAQDALARLEADTGAVLNKQVEVFIYDSVEDLKAALINPPVWIGGVNYPLYHIIMLAVPTNGLMQGQSDIAHELTHQVTYQVTANPYNQVPHWLNEGLSTYAEGLLDPVLASALASAVTDDTLISVRTLCSEFSAVPEKAYLSYGESYSLVAYLISTYKRAKMLELLQVFREGSTYDGALQQVYGFDMDGLFTGWKEWITGLVKPAARTTPGRMIFAGTAAGG